VTGDPESIRIEPPSEWMTAETADGLILAPKGHLGLPTMYLAGIVLDDGSIVMTLLYPGGKRYARVSPHTDWALEERPEGQPPAEKDRETINKVWREWLQTLINIGRFSRLVTVLFADLDEDEDEDEDDGLA
jgi:hypothetical protein